MKRVGERGEGRFERISWDEALKTVADKLRETVEKYGNESLYWQYCSGQGSVRISVSGEVIPGAAQRGCPLYLRCSMPDLMR